MSLASHTHTHTHWILKTAIWKQNSQIWLLIVKISLMCIIRHVTYHYYNKLHNSMKYLRIETALHWNVNTKSKRCYTLLSIQRWKSATNFNTNKMLKVFSENVNTSFLLKYTILLHLFNINTTSRSISGGEKTIFKI